MPGITSYNMQAAEHMIAVLDSSESGQWSFFPCVPKHGPARHAPSQAASARWVPPLALLG
jgi:hypothetical protein